MFSLLNKESYTDFTPAELVTQILCSFCLNRSWKIKKCVFSFQKQFSINFFIKTYANMFIHFLFIISGFSFFIDFKRHNFQLDKSIQRNENVILIKSVSVFTHLWKISIHGQNDLKKTNLLFSNEFKFWNEALWWPNVFQF